MEARVWSFGSKAYEVSSAQDYYMSSVHVQIPFLQRHDVGQTFRAHSRNHFGGFTGDIQGFGFRGSGFRVWGLPKD